MLSFLLSTIHISSDTDSFRYAPTVCVSTNSNFKGGTRNGGRSLPDIIKGTLPFVAHPYASEQCPYNIGQPVTLAVGPEGGFIPYEIKKLIECGFTAVHMGERTLHVESAISGMVSRLM